MNCTSQANEFANQGTCTEDSINRHGCSITSLSPPHCDLAHPPQSTGEDDNGSPSLAQSKGTEKPFHTQELSNSLLPDLKSTQTHRNRRTDEFSSSFEPERLNIAQTQEGIADCDTKGSDLKNNFETNKAAIQDDNSDYDGIYRVHPSVSKSSLSPSHHAQDDEDTYNDHHPFSQSHHNNSHSNSHSNSLSNSHSNSHSNSLSNSVTALESYECDGTSEEWAADYTTAQIRIVTEILDTQRHKVLVNNKQKYTLVQVPRHIHVWLLVDEENKPVVKLRASRLFSWLRLYPSATESERPLILLQPNASCGFGRMDWYRPGWGIIRLSRASRLITRVRDGKVTLPALGTLGAMPKDLGLTDNHIDFNVTWKQDGDQITLPVVIATSFIAMWCWSREPPLLATIGTYLYTRITRWLEQNIELEQLERLDKLGLRGSRGPQRLKGTTASICSGPKQLLCRTARLSPRVAPPAVSLLDCGRRKQLGGGQRRNSAPW